MKNYILTFLLALLVVLTGTTLRRSVAGLGGAPMPIPPPVTALGGAPMPIPPPAAAILGTR